MEVVALPSTNPPLPPKHSWQNAVLQCLPRQPKGAQVPVWRQNSGIRVWHQGSLQLANRRHGLLCPASPDIAEH